MDSIRDKQKCQETDAFL